MWPVKEETGILLSTRKLFIFIKLIDFKLENYEQLEWSRLKLDKNFSIAKQKWISFEHFHRCSWRGYNFKLGEQLCHGNLHFNHCEALPDANTRTTSKGKVRERNNLRSIGLHKPLGLKLLRFWEVLGVVVHCVERELDHGAFLDFEWTNFTVFCADTIQPEKLSWGLILTWNFKKMLKSNSWIP